MRVIAVFSMSTAEEPEAAFVGVADAVEAEAIALLLATIFVDVGRIELDHGVTEL